MQWHQTKCCITTFLPHPKIIYINVLHFVCPAPNLFSMCTTTFKSGLKNGCAPFFVKNEEFRSIFAKNEKTRKKFLPIKIIEIALALTIFNRKRNQFSCSLCSSSCSDIPKLQCKLQFTM